VKVDPALMASCQDKENMQPSQVNSKNEAQQKREAEQLKLAQEEQLGAEKETEKRRGEERRKQAEEDRLRREAEELRIREEAAAQQSRKEAAAAAAAEEERLRQEALRVAEEQERNEAAAAAAAEEERLRVEEAKRVALTKVNSWCKDNGYQSFSTAKKTFKGNTKYALHTAVKHESLEMVKMLLLCGAKKDVKDTKGQTPLQLAEKMKKGNIRDQIMDALR
jgi:nucleoid-associated protein YgaU